MSTAFSTGMSGPAAVAALNALDDAAAAYVNAVRFDTAQALSVTQQAQARSNINIDGVSVFDYLTPTQAADVVAGTAAVDTAAAFTSAIATGKPVHVPNGPGWAYLIGSQISVPSNTTIYSERAKLKLTNSANSHVFRVANGADNVEICGLEIDGNRTHNTGGIGIAMGGTGGTNIRIKDNYVHDCSSHGIYAAGSSACSGIDISGNYCYNNYSGGVTAEATVTKFAFQRNFCWNNGTHGVGILGVAMHGTIAGNVCWDNGQNTPSADNLTGYNASNDDIAITGNVSYGGENNGIHFGGSNISYVGNHVYGATYYGIYHQSNTGTATNVVISGNHTHGNGYEGIALYHVDIGSVSGNTSTGNRRGITTDTCTGITISNNAANGNTLQGIHNFDPSSHLTYQGNTVTGNTTDGISLAYVTKSLVAGNVVTGNGAWGINTGTNESHNIVGPNVVESNTTGQVNTMDSTTSVYGNYDGTNKIISGSGAMVLATSPTLVTPVLTTPDINGGTADDLTSLSILSTGTGTKRVGITSDGVMTGAHNLNIDLNDSGRTLSLGGNITIANSLITTGSGGTMQLNTAAGCNVTIPASGTLATVDGALGNATATTINKVTITQPASGSTLAIANGKTLTSSISVTFTGSDGCTVNFPNTSATIARTSGPNTFSGTQTFADIISGSTTVITSAGHLGLRSYTVATLPSATAQQLIYVSDGTSNKRLAVSDGTNWRWPDGAIVS